MKKTALIIILLTVSFLTCKNKPTDAINKEDKITVEIKVTKDGSPVGGYFVKVTATVGKTMWDGSGIEWEWQRLEIREENESITYRNGVAVFNFVDKSLSDNTIRVSHVKIFYYAELVIEDKEEKTVNRNTTARFEYEL